MRRLTWLVVASVALGAQSPNPPAPVLNLNSSVSTATGSNTPRLLSDRAADFGMSVLDYGAVCDGTTDDTTAIQNAINAAAPLQAMVNVPAGKTCKITATLNITASGVGLRCMGGTTVGTASACRLLWGGGASPMISFAPSAATYYNSVRNLTLDGNATATVGISVIGAQQGTLDNVHIRGMAQWAILSDTNGAAALNTQGWIVNNLFVDGATASMGGVELKCNDASGAVYCSAFWTFINPQISTGTSGGTAMLFNGGSNNNVIGGRMFGTAGNSIDLTQYIGASGSQSAIGNVLLNVYTQRPLIARGTTSIPTCTPWAGTGTSINTTCPFNNFFRLNTFSGGVDPTVEPGSQLNWQSNLANRTTQQTFMGDTTLPGLLVSNIQSAWGACINDALASGAQTAQWLCTTSTNAIETWDIGPNQDKWAWVSGGQAAGARDVQLNHPLGSGNVKLNAGLYVQSFTVATLPACSGAIDTLMAVVTDQAAGPVYNAAPTGGGALRMPVMCGAGTWHLH